MLYYVKQTLRSNGVCCVGLYYSALLYVKLRYISVSCDLLRYVELFQIL